MFNITKSVAAMIGRIALATVFSSAVLSAAVAPAVAAAPENNDRVQVRLVHTSDLDLTKPMDRAVLERRIEDASRKVCSDPIHQSLDFTGEYQACYFKAMKEARTQANTLIVAAQRKSLLASTR